MDDLFQRGEVFGKPVLLNQTRYDISPTSTILSCTLFSHISPEQTEGVSFGLDDFYHVSDWSVEAHKEAHLADLAWLNTEVESISRLEPERKVMIFTHYCPCTLEKVVDPRHVSSKVSSGFRTDPIERRMLATRNRQPLGISTETSKIQLLGKE